MRQARWQRAEPVFAVYNIPGRDCAGYFGRWRSRCASYAAWIDGVAKGIGAGKAVVILEPIASSAAADGLRLDVFTTPNRYRS